MSGEILDAVDNIAIFGTGTGPGPHSQHILLLLPGPNCKEDQHCQISDKKGMLHFVIVFLLQV